MENTTFDAITVSVSLIDLEGKILQCNKATADFLGKPINEIVGNTCWELVHGTSEPIKGCPIVRMRETRRPESLELPVGDRVFYVVTEPVLDQDGNIAKAVHTITDITERKQAEEAVRVSELKYRGLFDNSTDFIYTMDLKGNFTDVNKAAEPLTGYTKNELIGMNFRSFTQKDTHEEIFQAFNSVIKEGKPLQDFPLEVTIKDGTKRYFETSVGPLKKDNDIIGFQGSSRDITERKQADEKIKHLNLVLRSIRAVNQLVTKEKDCDKLLQGACNNLVETRGYYNAWIALFDESGKPLNTAEAGLGDDFLPMLERLKRGELTDCGRTALSQSDIVITEDPSSTCADCPLSEKYSGRGAMTIRLAYEGKVYGLLSVSIAADFTAYKEEQSLFKEVVNDIAFALHSIELEEKSKRADEALRESEEHYRSIFEDSRDAVYITTRDGKFIDANQSALDLFGYSREEMASVNALQLYVHPSDAGKFEKEIGEKGFLRDYEITFRKKDGTEMDCLLNTTLRRANDGSIMAYQGVIHDMTEHKKLEAQLQQAQKMEAIGTLAGGIAHDFNNILGAIIGYTEIAGLHIGDTDKLKEDLKKVLKAGRRATDLVKQILAFSRKGEQERIPVQIGLIIKEALKLLRSSLPTTIEISQNIESDTGIVEADPTQIHQILMNLCTNAGHAMREEGGILEVTLANVDIDARTIRQYPDMSPGPYLRLSG